MDMHPNGICLSAFILFAFIWPRPALYSLHGNIVVVSSVYYFFPVSSINIIYSFVLWEKWCFNAKITYQVCGLEHSFRCIIFTGSRKIQISGSKDDSWQSSEKACGEEFSRFFFFLVGIQKLGGRKNGEKRRKWFLEYPGTQMMSLRCFAKFGWIRRIIISEVKIHSFGQNIFMSMNVFSQP